MRHLSIWQKLLVGFLALGVANVVALVYLVGGQNEGIAVADKERAGLEYLAPLRQLRAKLPAERDVFRSGDPRSAQQTADWTSVDGDVTRLNELDLKLGPELGTTPDFMILRKAWEELKAHPNPAAASALEAKLEQLVRSLHTLVADTSGLVLDPALDTYYLMNASIVKIAGLIDRLDTLAESGAGAGPLALIGEQAASMRLDLDAAMAANAGMKSPIEAPLAQFNRALPAFLAAAAGGGQAAGVESARVDARARSFDLYDAAVGLLDQTLAERRQALAGARNRALIVFGTVLVLGMVICVAMARGVDRRLHRLIRAVREAAEGRRDQVGDVTADELGELTAAINGLMTSRAAGRASAASGAAGPDETLALKLLVADLALDNHRLRRPVE